MCIFMSDKIKVILFDVGGVVIDFDDSIYISLLNRNLHISKEKIRKALLPLLRRGERGSLKSKDMLRILSKRLGVSIASLQWNETVKKYAHANKQVLSLMRSLKKHYRIALLSNITFSRFFTMRGLIDPSLYEKLFASAYLHVRKPDKGIYLHVLKRLGVKPSEVVFIDNLKENVIGAQKVGIKAIQYTTMEKLLSELRKVGVVIR
jgi:epoxide hydrolase-like predicted phosphatase